MTILLFILLAELAAALGLRLLADNARYRNDTTYLGTIDVYTGLSLADRCAPTAPTGLSGLSGNAGRPTPLGVGRLVAAGLPAYGLSGPGWRGP